MEKLNSENVSLEFQVQSLIKEQENVKTEYQKLFNSIKRTQTPIQGEINELIKNVNQNTYAYADVHAQNQDLLITISELKAKQKNVEKGKSVNTKFDKDIVSNTLLCVTPLNKQVFQNKTGAPKTEEKHVLSKTVTLQTSPNKQQAVKTNKNVIASGMYKVKKTQNTNTNKAKSVLSSTGLRATSSVRRPSNRDSAFKNSVLSNTKNSLEKVEVSDRSNKKSDVASKNVDLNKKIVTNDDIKNSLIAKNVVQIVLWFVDSGCSKHMTDDRSLLENFIENFMGTVCFGNDHFATITGYGDYVKGNITVCHVYYVKGLGHNLFSVGQFCDGDLEVAFRSKTCYVRNPEGVICLQEIVNPICILSLFLIWLLLHMPMYEEYFENRSSETSINSVAQQVNNHDDSPSTSSIIVEEHEAHPIVGEDLKVFYFSLFELRVWFSFMDNQSNASKIREKTARNLGVGASGVLCDGSPKASNSSPLISRNATINMLRGLYNVDVATTFRVPLTTVGDLDVLIKDIEAGEHNELLYGMTNDKRMAVMDALGAICDSI
ncbi:hypothetical protein Tco_0672773, partial [Tanacetum coccineum]